MRHSFLFAVISALVISGSAMAFTIGDGEGNKVKISSRGVKVKASSGDEVVISPAGITATDSEGTTVNINGVDVNISTDGERNTKTGLLLANEHKIVMEARSSAMNFHEIEVSNAIRLIVEERTTGNIIVRAPQSVMPYISLKVKDGTLHATLLSGTPISRRSNVLAEVYVPYNGQINEITTSAAARVIVKPTLSCEELDLEASSASVIEVTASAKEVSIDASGASTIRAELATDELDGEFSGASSTSPSRLPRMFVENHPERPRQRVRSMGESTVFMSVCPVLKSLPAIGTFCCFAKSHISGMSIHKLGAPITKGAPSAMAA